MEQTRIAIVGCGGMGRRHLTGLSALYRSDYRNVELVAVCDLNRQNAEDLADEAAAALGTRPAVFGDLGALFQQTEGLEGIDVTTDTGSHHVVAPTCLSAGFNVLSEKPLALTMRGCHRILDAWRRSGKVLSIAENYRRDPINRLLRALIDAGAIGTPQLMLDTSVSGGNRLMITPWRHDKLKGTITLDAGVHEADIFQYYLGDVEAVYGEARLYEKYRYRTPSGGPGGFYAKWASQMPERVEATGEDALFSYLSFASGAIGQWIFHCAGHGEAFGGRRVFGSTGSILSPGDRNGHPITLFLDDGTPISDARILDYAPAFRLSPVAAQLFGGERLWTYDFPFPDIDAKILALEYHEFATCIQTGAEPEVSGPVAQRAVAIVYGAFESGRAGRRVTIDEVEALAVDAYQREIDSVIGLV